MTTLDEWRKGREKPQGKTVQEILDQRKQDKYQTIEQVRETAKQQNTLDRQQLIEKVLLSARLNQQNEMIEQIKNGLTIDEVLLRNKAQGNLV